MFLRKSRYKNAIPFDPSDHFSGVRRREIGLASGVIEHVISSGDRLDLLARHYYNDDRLWWRILDANPDILHAGDLCIAERLGETILIPRARQ
ncbi:hypothetical protein JYT48_02005 [Mariprofundus ferrooxydans]|nr:hypothetical protein [Mariprofundus ferrooxydans]